MKNTDSRVASLKVYHNSPNILKGCHTLRISHEWTFHINWPGCVAQSVGHLTPKSEVLGLIPSLATYFHFFLR